MPDIGECLNFLQTLPAAGHRCALLIFAVVYAGMLFGRLPGFALDRAGIAVLGSIALIACGQLSPQAAWMAVDVSTLTLLFGLMVVSAQFRFCGFYANLAAGLAALPVSPPVLLALLVAAVGLLSALLANDIVCLAMVSMLAEGCARRGLDPKPFLLALACAANIGSAATLIGNPQNMLIGQFCHLDFRGYLAFAAPPVLLSLAATWWIVCRQTRGRWFLPVAMPGTAVPRLDKWQFAKGAVILAALMAGFLATAWPREILAMASAGALLLSRRMSSRLLLDRVDWQVLLLFIGLFVVNRAFLDSGLPNRLAQAAGLGPEALSGPWLFTAAAVLSNLFSNVPAVMLLLPAAGSATAGQVLALSSSLAGNLLIAGSIANIIVVEQADRAGIRIGWRRHARTGLPVALASLLIGGFWLAYAPY